MKILQINDKCSLIGGSEKTLILSAKYLTKMNHEVTILHGDSSASIRNETPWKSIYLPEISNCTPLSNQKKIFDTLRQILSYTHPDVVHVRNFGGFKAAAYLAEELPVVRTVHTAWGYCPSGMKMNFKDKKPCKNNFGISCLLKTGRKGCNHRPDGSHIPIVEWFARYAACKLAAACDSRLSGIIVTSNYMRRMVADAGVPADIVKVIPPPIEISEDKIMSEVPKRSILYVGRLVEGKGAEKLIETLELIPNDVRLEIVGEGPIKKKLENLAKQLNVNERIGFHGWVNYDDLHNFYINCAVLAVPSIAAEAFGNIGPEAMAAGKCVVAFDSGGIGEWLKNGINGFLVPPGDISKFAEKLQFLIDNPDVAQKMGMAGRAKAEQEYSAEMHAQKTAEFYEESIIRWEKKYRAQFRKAA